MQISSHHLLSFEHLSQMVQTWTSSHYRLELLQRRIVFKAAPSEIEKISKVLNPDIVLYLVVRVLGWLVRDLSQTTQLDLNGAIKKYYRTLLMDEYFRHANLFQLFILFHIKITILFIQQHFDSIQIDSNLQCQLCVILYHAILGVEINEKAYQLLVNRYLIKDPKFNKISISSHTSFGQEPMLPKKSIVSVENKSKKLMESKKLIDSYHKNQKSHKMLRYSKMSFFGHSDKLQKYDSRKAETIEGILRENLKVLPLPKLKKKRMNIDQYKRMLTEPVCAETSPTKEEEYPDYSPGKHRSKFIFSNQLSTSIKTEYPDQLLFELNSRKVKLNQTFQNFQREGRLFHTGQNKNKENMSFYCQAAELQSVPRGKMQVQDWSEVVSDLKKRVYNLRWKELDPCPCQNDIPRAKKLVEGSTESLRRGKKLLTKVSIYAGDHECL